MSIECKLSGQCSGCPWIGVPYTVQLERKKESFSKLAHELGVHLAAPGPDIVSVAESGLRDRVDFSLRIDANGRHLGLYDTTRSLVLDISECPQLSSNLKDWLSEFRSELPPGIEKGSVRLRVSPDGKRGAWLDLANLDIKSLLDEGSWLERLHQAGAVIELGQRFKRLIRDESTGKLRLATGPEPLAWFETYLGETLTPTPLYGCVGSFTQPGFKANRALVGAVKDLAQGLSGSRALELFSGLGNFTLPLASWGLEVMAYEVDDTAVLSFEQSLAHAPAHLRDKVALSQKNLYASSGELPKLAGFDVLFVDPPRSGLREVADLIETTPAFRKPRVIIYVSCFAESMLKDLVTLERSGYAVKRVVGIDQFPQSEHCEWIARLELK